METLKTLWENIKIVCSWIGIILTFGSFALNFYFAGIIYTNNDIIKDTQNYLQYKDSVQLELMDRITDRNNTVRK